MLDLERERRARVAVRRVGRQRRDDRRGHGCVCEGSTLDKEPEMKLPRSSSDVDGGETMGTGRATCPLCTIAALSRSFTSK